MPAGRGRCATPCGACQKVFLTSSQTRPTALGSCLKRLRLAAAHSLTLARLRAEFAIDRQENMRFCRAEMPSYYVKALENTQSILCGLFLVCEHFCSGRTCFASDSLGFSRDFVLLDAGGLSPAKDKRAKAPKKDWLSDAWVSCPSMADFCRRTRRRQKCFALFICACGRKLCEAFSTGCAGRGRCATPCVFSFIRWDSLAIGGEARYTV